MFMAEYYFGLELLRPLILWLIQKKELSSLKTKGFLDGIYIEKNHNKRFMVTIFDIQKDDFSLHEFVDQQISLMESQKDVTVPFEQVSTKNDWALFAVESTDNVIPYGEQLLFLKDNRLYMLQYSGDSPQTLDSEQKNDFKFNSKRYFRCRFKRGVKVKSFE
mgnify:CR=1 FL=1